jgi:hypothetical protein
MAKYISLTFGAIEITRFTLRPFGFSYFNSNPGPFVEQTENLLIQRINALA